MASTVLSDNGGRRSGFDRRVYFSMPGVFLSVELAEIEEVALKEG